MALYELGGFRFHTILDAIPISTEIEVTDLGEWMSRATPCTKQMTINNAKATLEAYLRLMPNDDRASRHGRWGAAKGSSTVSQLARVPQ